MIKLKRLLIIYVFTILLITPMTMIVSSESSYKPKGWYWYISWSIHPDELYPGVEGYVDVWLENSGDQKLYIYRVWFQWEWQGDVAYYKSVSVYLDPGEKKYLGRVGFNIPTTISPSYYGYRVGVSQKHKESYGWVNDGVVWMAGWREVRILEAPSIKIITADVNPDSIYVGDTINITVIVKNNGEATAKNVSLDISVPSSLSVVLVTPNGVDISGGSTKQFIVSISCKSSGEYNIVINAYSDNGGSYAIPVTISVKKRPLLGLSPNNDTLPMLTFLIASIVVAVTLIAVLLLRRRY